jgi:hypothetical protein
MWKLLIANHLDQSICLADLKQGALIRSYLLHSMQEQYRFAELNQRILTFVHLILMCRVTY